MLAAPAVVAQPPTQPPRIGFLSPAPFPGERDALILRRLTELGWVEGRTVTIERRSAENRNERLPRLAEELARQKVNLIVAFTTPAVDAARKATRSIPIVMAPAGDALGSGFVKSLARPEGNVTGVTFTHETVGAKRLELLRDVLPRLKRVAVLAAQEMRILHEPMWKAADAAAPSINLAAQLFEVRDTAEIESAFSAMARDGMDAVVVLPGEIFASERERIARLAVAHRLVSICDRAEYVQAGCLMSYGADLGGLLDRAATHVDRILRGAKPGDLPVEQPTRFELTINRRTARDLGLTIPQSVVLRADRMVE